VTQKLACVIERVVAHGERVYTLVLRPERPVPRFLPGQFLHLALDPYDPAGFWPESRVFSIASGPNDRSRVSVTYAVHGRFTARLEAEALEGRTVWVKLPYGDFVVDNRRPTALLAGGTGVTAFTAMLESLTPSSQPVALAYGARTPDLLIYRQAIEACAASAPALDVLYFAEEGSAPPVRPGRVTVDALWERLTAPLATDFYISGPPAMLRGLAADLRARDVAPDAIHIDAWE
jgi:ferredoxin-NADP reductase